MHQLGRDFYISTSEMPDVRKALSTGKIGSVLVFNDTSYSDDRVCRVMVDGKPSGFAAMRGTPEGMRQANADIYGVSKANAWQFSLANKLGRSWGAVYKDKPIFSVQSSKKPRLGPFGISATCHDKYLDDRFKWGFELTSGESAESMQIRHFYQNGLWLGTICAISFRGVYDMMSEWGESLCLEAA